MPFGPVFFILMSIALVIVVIVAISGVSRFTEHFNKYVVTFGMVDDLGGLRVGDDVRLGGLKLIHSAISRFINPPVWM